MINLGSKGSNFGLGEIVRNAIAVLFNKIQFKHSRLVRYPIIIRGRKYIDWGTNLTTGYNCRIEVNGSHDDKILKFGDGVNIGDEVSIRCAAGITIGDNVLMGSRVLVIDNSHGKYSGDNQDSPSSIPNKRQLIAKPIIINKNVWVGEGSVIQAGVEIGEGSVIAANSVVTKSVESNVIVGGVPARILKRWNNELERWERSYEP